LPAPAHARASPYPVGPASYTTRTGAGSVSNHATVSALPAGTRNDHTSPLTPSITPATTDRACTSSPTQLPSFITGASRKLRLYRRANPDGNPHQLTSAAPGTPYGLAQPTFLPLGATQIATARPRSWLSPLGSCVRRRPGAGLELGRRRERRGAIRAAPSTRTALVQSRRAG